MSWNDLNSSVGSKTTGTLGSVGGWAALNTFVRSSSGASTETKGPVVSKPLESVMGSRSYTEQTPYLSNASISSPNQPTSKLGLEGVTYNKPTSLYGTETGQPIINVDPNKFQVTTNEDSNFLQRMAAGAANVVSQSVISVTKAFGDVFNMAIVDTEAKREQDTGFNSANSPLPELRQRVESGQPAVPTVSEKVGAGLNLAASTASLAFAPISAQLTAAEEIPIIGKPVFGTVNKGFELLDHASRFVGGKALDALPISDESKLVLRQPVEDLAGIVGTLFGVKAIHVASSRGGGKVVDALPVSDSTKGTIRGGVQLGAGVALNPFGVAYKGIVSSMRSRVENRIKMGEEITPEIARRVVNETVKEVETPKIQALMEVPTRSGSTKIHTDQKLVLENLIKGQESLNYKVVEDLGISLKTKEPITSRFEWDYNKQQGTIFTTDKTTAVDLAHELGHYVDRQLGVMLNKRLSDVLPEYVKNQGEVNQLLADYALESLGKNATYTDINAEIVKIANKIRQEILDSNAQSEFIKPAETFAKSVSSVLSDPLKRKASPELARLVDYSLNKEVTAKVERNVSLEKTTPKTTESKKKTGTSKVGESIARKAIEQKLEDSYGETAGYEKINIKDQAERVEKIINTDIEQAKRIMTGEEALPDGLRAGAFIKAMEDYALRTGDAQLAFELANSPLISETSIHAQEMRLLAERSPDSATARLQQIKKARVEAAQKSLKKGQTVNEVVKKTGKEIDEVVKKSRPKKEDWTSFIDSIKC